MLYPDAHPIFQSFRKLKQIHQNNSDAIDLSVGIISNTDDRVLPVLSGLGLSIGPLRHGGVASNVKSGVHLASKSGEVTDIDFVTLSYDVGYEKPSPEIFDAAKGLASLKFETQSKNRYIHVGDDLNKDFNGAQQAGWEAFLLDREASYSRSMAQEFIISSLLELESRLSLLRPRD